MATLRADAARNYDAILRTAADLLQSAVEPRDVSMDVIARAAGVGKGTLFRRFGDREGLISAVVSERLEPLKKEVESGSAPLGPQTPPRERILAVLEAIVTFKIDTITLNLAHDASGSSAYSTASYQFAHDLFTQLLIDVGVPSDASLCAHLLLAPTRADFIAHVVQTEGRTPEEVRAMVKQNAERLLAG